MRSALFGVLFRFFLIGIGLFPYSFVGVYLGEFATPIYWIIAAITLHPVLDKKIWSLGLSKHDYINNWSFGLLLGAFSMLTVFTIVYFLGGHKIVSHQFNINTLLVWMSICFVVAFSEELLIRGYLYGFMLKHFGVMISVIGSSLVFAVLHLSRSGFDIFAFSTLFLAGLVYALMRQKTGAIWLCFGFHFAWNFFSGVLGIWRDRTILIEVEVSQQSLINGGMYGIEGSIVSVLFFLVLVTVVYVWNENSIGIKG
ncbi:MULTISPECIES: type II CAAX endopeptidase family protein [Bacillales]|uniref:CPBP family intramembrane glutamic endopeptidase n=1 Tax=Bacillales TaxID=1385 RepID=UPI000344D8D8|nr:MULTISPECIES: type II CAAX endopeptidase family protein [Bacillales]KMZ41330.1 hypothetical protein AC624_09620 [Bacillus sp. FJAT-27238]